MALQAVTFRIRALTSLVFVAVMLTGLLWNAWSFFILFSIIHFGCWYEYQKLMAKIDPAYGEVSSFQRYGVMIAGWCIMMYGTKTDYSDGNVNFHTIGLYGGILFLFILPVAEILYTRKTYIRNMGYSALGLIYISLSLGLLMNLRTFYADKPLDDVNKLLVMIIILSLWVNDTMAYLVGSIIGKTPLSKISPKKTWEGTIGGFIFCVLTMGLAGYVAGYFLGSGFDLGPIVQWMVIAAISAIFGTIGDLLQSKLKRLADVKDSGSIMPGHGGFLDRFDSLLFATPFVWLYIVMFA